MRHYLILESVNSLTLFVSSRVSISASGSLVGYVFDYVAVFFVVFVGINRYTLRLMIAEVRKVNLHNNSLISYVEPFICLFVNPYLYYIKRAIKTENYKET